MDATVFATAWAAALYTRHILAYAVGIAFHVYGFLSMHGSQSRFLEHRWLDLWSIIVGPGYSRICDDDGVPELFDSRCAHLCVARSSAVRARRRPVLFVGFIVRDGLGERRRIAERHYYIMRHHLTSNLLLVSRRLGRIFFFVRRVWVAECWGGRRPPGARTDHLWRVGDSPVGVCARPGGGLRQGAE